MGDKIRELWEAVCELCRSDRRAVWLSDENRVAFSALIEADRAAVANQVLDEYMALVNQMIIARARTGEPARLNFFRAAYAELKTKYAPKGGG